MSKRNKNRSVYILIDSRRCRLFGGALAKVEGRARLQPSWALLLTDLLVFARVSRDRVLFVTEEPLRLSNIAEACFTVRKRPTEFRLQIAINPSGSSENGHVEVTNSGGCSPHSRPRRRVLILRAPTPELKAVWHNLLQRQMYVASPTWHIIRITTCCSFVGTLIRYDFEAAEMFARCSGTRFRARRILGQARHCFSIDFGRLVCN